MAKGIGATALELFLQAPSRIGAFFVAAAKGDAWALYDLKTDRAEQNDLSAKMPEKAKELADLWQKQTDEYVALAKLTLAEQPKGKAGKGAAKKKAK